MAREREVARALCTRYPNTGNLTGKRRENQVSSTIQGRKYPERYSVDLRKRSLKD
ncbi:Hypothetical predicted protein [Scomber scombrus]|uniref:Uncharacterized protein n=1 Tax=Scomber scombrus TaxID=13677 RepID=A0AAV1QG28_SCOSC